MKQTSLDNRLGEILNGLNKWTRDKLLDPYKQDIFMIKEPSNARDRPTYIKYEGIKEAKTAIKKLYLSKLPPVRKIRGTSLLEYSNSSKTKCYNYGLDMGYNQCLSEVERIFNE